MVRRLPANIHMAAEVPAYPELIRKSLHDLADRISSGKFLEPLRLPAWDKEGWDREFQPYSKLTWHDCPWFFGETYAFRLVLQHSRYFENAIDPFGPRKEEELRMKTPFLPIQRFVDLLPQDIVEFFAHEERQISTGTIPSYENIPHNTRIQVLEEALHLCMWGNKADLSFTAGGQLDHSAGDSELLLVNHDTPASRLLSGSPGTVHIVMDNSGAELAGDLILAFALVVFGGHRVMVHPKAYPTYVSDTIVPDIHRLLEVGSSNPIPQVRHFCQMIQILIDTNRITLAPDDYWCRTQFLCDMPDRIFQLFSNSLMVVVKGDFNYRRAMGDTIWEPDTPGREAMGFQQTRIPGNSKGEPVPFLFLRTMKSDCLAGVPERVTTKLDTVEPGWRIQGRRGLIQLV